MKKILVTGGAGFIGSHLVEKLLAESLWQVTLYSKASENLSIGLCAKIIQIHLPLSIESKN